MSEEVLVAGYAVAGLFAYPVWNSDKWPLAAAVAPVHCVLFWYGTKAVRDARYVAAPVVLAAGSVVTAFSDRDTAVYAGVATAVLFLGVCVSGKTKASLM